MNFVEEMATFNLALCESRWRCKMAAIRPLQLFKWRFRDPISIFPHIKQRWIIDGNLLNKVHVKHGRNWQNLIRLKLKNVGFDQRRLLDPPSLPPSLLLPPHRPNFFPHFRHQPLRGIGTAEFAALKFNQFQPKLIQDDCFICNCSGGEFVLSY